MFNVPEERVHKFLPSLSFSLSLVTNGVGEKGGCFSCPIVFPQWNLTPLSFSLTHIRRNQSQLEVAQFRFLRITIPVPWGILEESEPELEAKES